MHTDKPHIKKLLQSGLLSEVDAGLNLELDNALAKLPWLGASLDWSSIPGHHLIDRVNRTPDEELKLLVQLSHFCDYDYALAYFNSNEPVLCGYRDDIVRNLDLIYWGAPGVRFVFAATKTNSKVDPILSTFLQYGKGDVLYVSR